MRIKIILSLILIVILFSSCNFSGLSTSQNGRYFRSYLKPDYDSSKYSIIGVYAFSENIYDEAYSSSFGGDSKYGLSDFFGPNIIKIFTIGFVDFYIFDKEIFPSEISKTGVYHPLDSARAADDEIAKQTSSQLSEIGYVANIARDFTKNGRLTLDDIFSDAQKNGFELAYVINYSGVRKWFKGNQSEYKDELTSKTIFIETGFLYLPNVSVYNVKTKQLVWKYCYYGLVRGAHGFNLSGEPMNYLCTEVINSNGGADYVSAAQKAVKSIFAPNYFKKTYIPFPAKIPEQLKKRI